MQRNKMDKIKLHTFSLSIRELLKNESIDEAQQKIKEKGFNGQELEFIFMCLRRPSYNPKTGLYLVNNTDNSAFLSLVNIIQSKTSVKKQKYKIVSHYVGDRDINEVLEGLAIRRALYEYNYEGGFKKSA
jgi:hypothetical protein